MIELLNNLLRASLLDGINELTDETQIRFQPPDDDWRTYVSNLTVGGNPVNAVNAYLVDLRENRGLRSNERTFTHNQVGDVTAEPAPARLDCHYLITTWSPATPTPAVEPSLDEHRLLYNISELMLRRGALIPSAVYPVGSGALAAWPERFRDSELPLVPAPVDGFSKLAEFWGSMGTGGRWKPALYLIVTLPVALLDEFVGPMVTTKIVEYRQTGIPETAEVWISIGGRVLDSNTLVNNEPTAVPEAWVELTDINDRRLQLKQTNELGRFTFEDLTAGRYKIKSEAIGLSAPPRVIDVPSPTGEDDLILS
jgi:hypothetical protein